MIAHGDRKAPCRAATCAPIRIIYQRRMVNALLSIVQRNCSRTFACVHSICGDIGAINDSIIAQHVNILRREASNGSVGSDRESIPHFGRPLHAPRVVSPPKSVSGILLGSTRSDLGGYTSKGGAPVLSPARSPLADFDLTARWSVLVIGNIAEAASARSARYTRSGAGKNVTVPRLCPRSTLQHQASTLSLRDRTQAKSDFDLLSVTRAASRLSACPPL